MIVPWFRKPKYRTFVLALNLDMAKRWCQRVRVNPHAKTTHLIGSVDAVRGRQITDSDRVVCVGPVWSRKDFPQVMAALSIAGARRIEHVS